MRYAICTYILLALYHSLSQRSLCICVSAMAPLIVPVAAGRITDYDLRSCPHLLMRKGAKKCTKRPRTGRLRRHRSGPTDTGPNATGASPGHRLASSPTGPLCVREGVTGTPNWTRLEKSKGQGQTTGRHAYIRRHVLRPSMTPLFRLVRPQRQFGFTAVEVNTFAENGEEAVA